MTFAKWMDRIDDLCQSDDDMAIHDLPELFFRDAYRRGCSPLVFLLKHTTYKRAGIFLATVGSPVLPCFGLVRAMNGFDVAPSLTKSPGMSHVRLSGVLREGAVD